MPAVTLAPTETQAAGVEPNALPFHTVAGTRCANCGTSTWPVRRAGTTAGGCSDPTVAGPAYAFPAGGAYRPDLRGGVGAPAQVPAAAVVAAMTGPVPKPGGIVRITERAAIEFARNPVPNFRVTDVELIKNWPGWCRIRGWDIDRIGDPHGGPIEHVWHRVLVSGLVIRPGDGWNR